MENITINQVVNATKGIYYGKEKLKSTLLTSVVIDSRKAKEGSLFIALPGEKVDGHSFIPEVVKSGALCIISEKKLSKDLEPYILVDSSKKAFIEFAKYLRGQLDIKVVGVTGSVGKTSPREMIASVLSEEYKVFKTTGNHNNDLGISLMLSGIDNSIEIAVLEMGISEFGEMHLLSEIVRPDICVINNIEPCHLESLGDLDGVLKAKTEMFDFMAKDGNIVLNGDSEKLIQIQNVKGIKPVFFGINKKHDVYAENIEKHGLKGTSAMLVVKGEAVPVNIPVPGEHVIMNALAAAAVGNCMNISYENIKKGVENVSGVEGRLNIIENKNHTIIDDCYNASPASMKAGISVLASAEGRKVAILGDMLELGNEKEQYHMSTGEFAAEEEIDLIICIGELGKLIKDGADKANKGNSEVVYFMTKEEFMAVSDKYINKGDVILVKASNGMKFKEILNHLKK